MDCFTSPTMNSRPPPDSAPKMAFCTWLVS